MNQLHNVYCDVYCLFNHWWNAANPSSIMEFTAVFGESRTCACVPWASFSFYSLVVACAGRTLPCTVGASLGLDWDSTTSVLGRLGAVAVMDVTCQSTHDSNDLRCVSRVGFVLTKVRTRKLTRQASSWESNYAKICNQFGQHASGQAVRQRRHEKPVP
jgi:hypothetical protein